MPMPPAKRTGKCMPLPCVITKQNSVGIWLPTNATARAGKGGWPSGRRKGVHGTLHPGPVEMGSLHPAVWIAMAQMMANMNQ